MSVPAPSVSENGFPRPKYLKDLREYIEGLRALGEMVEVPLEVDWNLEMGAIIRRCYELGAPAPLFQRIKGSGPEFRAFGAPAGTSHQPGLYLCRVALSLGLPPTASGRDIVEALVAARKAPLIAPRIVTTGPCKENKISGKDLDLTRLPVPLPHFGDGGRYINTWGTVVARTPEGRWTNWAIARVMLLDRNRMAGIVHPLQHLGQIHGMWKKIGKPMPFAMFQGGPPFIPFVSSMPIPAGVNEADYMGGYFGEPVELVKCETVDLEVPATSEIVIEGYISDVETAMEGPMGEYAGYVPPGEGTLKPVYHATAMTYRNQAILPVVIAGEPVEEDHTAQGIPSAAELLFQMREAKIPVTMVWTTLESAQHWLVVTVPRDCRSQIRCTGETLCRRIGEHVFEKSKFGAVIPKILVMNDDIDATNLQEVVWAFATRCHPFKGEIHFNKEATSPLVAFLETAEKTTGITTKVVYNCLPPEDWGDRLPKRTAFQWNYPRELQEKIIANWRSYGFPA